MHFKLVFRDVVGLKFVVDQYLATQHTPNKKETQLRSHSPDLFIYYFLTVRFACL